MRLPRFAFLLSTMLALLALSAVIALVARQTYLQPDVNWQPFSKSKITAANARGQIVLVSFSANW